MKYLGLLAVSVLGLWACNVPQSTRQTYYNHKTVETSGNGIERGVFSLNGEARPCGMVATPVDVSEAAGSSGKRVNFKPHGATTGKIRKWCIVYPWIPYAVTKDGKIWAIHYRQMVESTTEEPAAEEEYSYPHYDDDEGN